MTELLLITDIPRLRKIFSRIADEPDIRLRVSTSLENGAAEILAAKPAIIFVQTHLSGFSPEILLMHLKKQLGRKRSRFILLSSKEQVNDDLLKLYQGHLDTSLDDNQLLDALLLLLDNDRHISKAEADQPLQAPPAQQVLVPENTEQAEFISQFPGETPNQENQLIKTQSTGDSTNEPSLEEQGVIYSRRTPLSVYSEFTSSFDTAVNSMPTNEPEQKHDHWSDMADDATDFEPVHTRPRWVTLLLWTMPLLAVVVAATLLQQWDSKPKPLNIAPSLPAVAPARDVSTPPVAPAAPAAPIVQPDKNISNQPVAAPAPIKEAAPPAAKEAASTRLTKLPDFIPADKRDISFSKSNPGWELFKGRKTDFKVFRENNTIKAVQVIDRNGTGISDTLTSNILKQLATNPKFVLESSEKKDGYEIRRGRLKADLTMVHYLDANTLKLRAFVITWR